MKVCYTGFWASYSGMGEAARNIITALNTAGVELTTELAPNYVSEQNLGPNYKLCQKLQNLPLDYNIKIIHTTPDLVTKFMSPMKYHIFHLFWETDKLPDWWVWALNLVDEIWTGSEWNKETFMRSGVKKPIWVCPQPVETVLPAFKPFVFKSQRRIIDHNKTFLFYDIFQWIERKDPRTLLQAYWETFKPDDPVGLVLKTYKEKFESGEQDEIISDILKWKKELGFTNTPPVYLYTHLMSRGDVYRLHTTGNAFVSAHRGEGFGIPIAEAMNFGKPVISTNLGGINEYLHNDIAYLTKFTPGKVFNMEFVPWYGKDQGWGQVDLNDLKAKMRYIYNHREEAKKVGLKGQKFIKSELSYKNVGLQMANRLKTIEGMI